MERVAKTRILSIVPYEGLRTLLERAVEVHPQVSMDVFIGNMEGGCAIARERFSQGYDVILSRGGTARRLQEEGFPVAEVEISPYDILCALKLSDGLREKTAMVVYANITADTKVICELLDYRVDLFPAGSIGELEPILRRLQEEGYTLILADTVGNGIARRMGFNSILITSGPESVRRGVDQALLLSRSVARQRRENRFFRQVLQGCQTVVLENDSGTVAFSTVETVPPELLTILRGLLPGGEERERRVMRQTEGGRFWSIRFRRLREGEQTFTVFYLDRRRTPLPPSQMGIHTLSRQEAEEAVGDLFNIVSLDRELWGNVCRLCESSRPLLVSGENGTGKKAVVSMLYAQGRIRGGALISINCGVMNEKGWSFLLEQQGSPLLDVGNVLHFFNVDVLSTAQRRKLIEFLREMEVCRYNRVILSCVCRPGEKLPEGGTEFLEQLGCLSLYLPPLRQMRETIPTLLHLLLSHRNADSGHPVLGAGEEALQLLREYRWPHNYTQFQRVILEIAAQAPGQTITVEHTRRVLQKERYECVLSSRGPEAAVPLDLDRPLREIERDIVCRVLAENGNNQTEAARRLGLSRTTLWRLLREK